LLSSTAADFSAPLISTKSETKRRFYHCVVDAVEHDFLKSSSLWRDATIEMNFHYNPSRKVFKREMIVHRMAF
jgi:hypothetical protein